MLGLAAFGWSACVQYLTVIAPFMRGYIEAPFGLASHYMMVAPLISFRALGAGVGFTYGLQASNLLLNRTNLLELVTM